MGCSLDRIKIDYQPTAIVRIMAFVSELQNTQPTRKMSALEGDIQVKDSEPMEVNLTLTDTKLTMINKLNNLPLAVLKLKKVTTSIKMTSLETLV
jgi:hypothetical protein